jgi:hypothetical protein
MSVNAARKYSQAVAEFNFLAETAATPALVDYYRAVANRYLMCALRELRSATVRAQIGVMTRGPRLPRSLKRNRGADIFNRSNEPE